APLPGLYLPAGYEARFREGRFAGLEPRPGFPERVERQWVHDLAPHPTHSRFLTPETVFRDMPLLEPSRGCPHPCRFCTAGYADNPPRHHPLARLLGEAEAARPHTRRVGLVAPSPGDHPAFGDLVARLVAQGFEVSPSSIRIDHLTPEVVELLVRSGNRSLTLAPEGGSDHLRGVISKGFTEAQILAAAEALAAAGLHRVKLYLMVGLPEETEADVAAAGELVAAVRDRFLPHWRRAGRAGSITVSLNQLVPKPHTPFQWEGLAPFETVAARIAALRARLEPLGNVRLDTDPPLTVAVEAALSRGDRRAADLLLAAARDRGRWRRALPAWLAATGTDLHAPLDPKAPLPWSHVATGLITPYLAREAHRARLAKVSRPCPPDLVGCHKCGIC
ncbi:MAG: radical SAM protein, partial [Nitrospirae bacterium]